jgi:hypothetical protein
VNERARQGCQRLDRIHTVGRKRPRFVTKAVRLKHEGPVSMTVRRSGPGRRETSCPPVTPYGAQDSVGHPRRESGESEPGTHEVRAHAVRLGGRNRSDASRVFHTGRSQGLLVSEGR